MNECLTCGRETTNPKFCSRGCVRGKHTKPHTKESKKRIGKANDGHIGFTNDLKDREPERIKNQLGKIKGINRKHILKFYYQVQADGLASITIRRYLFELNNLSKLLGKDFKRANKDDIVRLCGQIESTDKWNVKSKAMLKIILKKLYKILEGDNEEYPKKVRWVKIRNGVNYKLPESILTEQDIREIVKVCYDIREKSFIAMHYLTGCRSGELLNLRIKDIEFDDKGAVFTINGTKTIGSKRRVRITSGLDLLKLWLEQHPFSNPDSLVFLMDYWASRGLIRKINRRLKARGFTKHNISSHDFRRARATYLAGEGLNAFELLSFFGWRKPSTALHYIRLSNKQLDNSLCSLPKMVF